MLANLPRYLEFMKEFPELFALAPDAPWRIETDPRLIENWTNQQPAVLKEIGVLWEDAFYIILRDLIVTKKGQTFGHLRFVERGCLKGNRSVAVLPMLGNKVLLLTHYRYPITSWSCEVPRGFGEENISPRSNMLKELQEEMNITKVEEIIDLGHFYPQSGSNSTDTNLYLVRLAADEAIKANEEQISNIVKLTVSEFEQWLAQGKNTDSFTLATYALAKARGLL